MEYIIKKKTDEGELMHYGVLGMKWGHRKALPTSSTYNNYKRAKAEKKAANKEYSKAFNRANSYSGRHFISQYTSKAKKAESDRRWDDTFEKAKKANDADLAYKKAKLERKTAIKNTASDLNKKASLGEKIMYNNATRTKAAEYIVDNNMSVSEATKKAQGDARRNTAIVLAAYGAVAAASLYKVNH